MNATEENASGNDPKSPLPNNWTAFSISVSACSPEHNDWYYPFLDEEDDGPDSPLRQAHDSEKRGLIATYSNILSQLGCVATAGDDEPVYYLLVDGSCELPIAQILWAPDVPPVPTLGIARGQPASPARPFTMTLMLLAKAVEPSVAFSAVKGLGRDHFLSAWGGERTPNRLPATGEEFEDWMGRVAVPVDYVRSIAARLERYNFSLRMALALPTPSTQATPDFAVEGLFPYGDTAVLVAPSGTGKSTFAHHLLAVLSAPVREGVTKTFLGRDVPGQSVAALLSGEESDWYFARRQQRLSRSWPGSMIIRPTVTRATFRSELAGLREFAIQNGFRRGFLVVDNITNFVEGDDTRSSIASEFQQLLRDFAVETGWGVLGITHTTKEVPRAFANFRRAVKGSSVHVDMPRNTYGLLTRGADLTEFGTVVSNMPSDVAWLLEGESVLCEFDSENDILDVVKNEDEAHPAPTGEHIELVAAAVGELNELGRRVHRTGDHSLFALKLPNLAKLTRKFLQQAIEALIDSGRLEVTPAGLILNAASLEK